MRGNIKSFEKPFTHAEVVALAERTLKRFGGDKNKAGRYARSMENRYESSKWALVVEVLATSRTHHATKKPPAQKSPAQLQREIDETLAPRTVHHATRSGLKLTEHQKTMLRMAFDTGRMSSGRYGWNEMHVRALEKKGLVTLVSRATWDKEWKLTDLGRETAKTLHSEWLELVK